MSETKKAHGGTPQHEPTEVTRALVEGFLSFGIPQVNVANYIGISCPKTLRKHYKDIIDKTMPIKLHKLMAKAFDKALNDVDMRGNTGNPTLLIFLLKTIGGLKEKDSTVLDVPLESVDKIKVTVFPAKEEPKDGD